MDERPYRRVAVLMGGPSAERDVSLASGRAVARGLEQAGYAVEAVDLRDRTVELPDGVEAVFIALHGEFGEDGELQAMLNARGIPYTGSGAEASRLAFDKKLSKRVFAEHDVPTAPFEIMTSADKRLPAKLPAVVKPLRQGSSIGVHIVHDAAEWDDALADALRYGAEVLVERFIDGIELTVGIVAGDVLPAVRIAAPDGNYDYRAKYTKGTTRYVVPADISPSLAQGCRDAAGRAFEAFGCRGLARVDFRATANGEYFALELNSIPGFTETSLLPMAAAEAGMSFPELCDRIMRTARTDEYPHPIAGGPPRTLTD